MTHEELSPKARARLWLRLGIRFCSFLVFILIFFHIGIPLLSFCMPFVIGIFIAWLLEPLVRRITQKGFSRKWTSLILVLLLCGIFGGVISLFVYKIFAETASLSANWSDVLQSLNLSIQELSQFANTHFANLHPSLSDIAANLSTSLVSFVQNLGTEFLIPKTTSFAVAIPWGFLSTIFALMALFFAMADFPSITKTLVSWLPKNCKNFLSFLEKTFLTAFNGYIRAQFFLSVVVFFILLTGYSLMGIPYALLLAFVFSILDFIPIIGSGTFMVPWALIDLALGNWQRALTLMLLWGSIVLFRRIAEPKFVGSQTGLHPFLALLALFVGMRAFGVWGMVFAPPIFLVVINVCRSGVFSPLVADISLAFQDITAILLNRNIDANEEQKEENKSNYE